MYPEDSAHFLSSEEDAKEMVNIDSWVKKFADPSSVYECLEILPDSTKPRWRVDDAWLTFFLAMSDARCCSSVY